MRYAIISDLHANYHAWNAVIIDAESIGVDVFICLGDIVGYGPSPVETLTSVRTYVRHFVAGNHDAAVAGTLDAACFNEEARQSVKWTVQQLDRASLRFLRRLPLMLEGPSFRCAHANAACPQLFDYIFDAEDARSSWESLEQPLLFIGHTHQPQILVTGASGKTHQVPAQDFGLEDGKRYIVNAGSVGLPRDGDRRASYCIFDEETASVWFRRIPFDVATYFSLFSNASGPVENPSYLNPLRPEYQAGSIQPRIDFNPPADGVDDGTQVQRVDVLSLDESARRNAQRAHRWKIAASLCGVVALALTAWMLVIPRTASPPGVYVPSVSQQQEDRALALPEVGNYHTVKVERSGPVTEQSPLQHWSVHLKAPAQQQVIGVEPGTDKRTDQNAARALRLKSGKVSRLLLTSPPFRAPAGSRVRITASFKRRAWTKGVVKLILFKTLSGESRSLVSVIDTEPAGLLKPEKHWRFTSETMENEFSQDTVVQVGIEGRFVGDILVQKCRLHRKEKL